MNYLVPYDDSDLARIALREACRVVTPLDRIIVLAAVVVPPHLATDVAAGEVWKQTCRAEVHLAHARAYAARIAHYVDGLRCVRVQAGTRVAAIIAGATFYEADTIVLAERAGARSRLAMLFGPVQRLVRSAPCDVRVVYRVGPDDAARRARAAARPAVAAPAPLDQARETAQQATAPECGGITPYVNE